MFIKILLKFIGKHLFWSLVLNIVAGLRPPTLFKKEATTQMFSREFCKIFKNIFFDRTPPVTAFSFTKIVFHNRAMEVES